MIVFFFFFGSWVGDFFIFGVGVYVDKDVGGVVGIGNGDVMLRFLFRYLC